MNKRQLKEIVVPQREELKRKDRGIERAVFLISSYSIQRHPNSPKLLQAHDTIINFSISVVGWITTVPRSAICQPLLRVKLW